MSLHVSCRADDSDKHEFDINYLMFQKGKLYSAGDDGKIKMWAADLKLLAQIQAHPCSVYCLAASDDTLFSCSNEGTVKTWNLNTLEPKEILLKDTQVEFWQVRYENGVLYIGDGEGNIKIIKDGKYYGSINVAEPVKDIIVSKNLVITGKDNDITITDLHLGGQTPKFGVVGTLMGRVPITLVNDKLMCTDRPGKSIIVHRIIEGQHVKEAFTSKDAHEMIINAMISVFWDGKEMVFSGGWDKKVKQWKIGESLIEEGTANVDIVVNAMAGGEQGELYAGGSDGHIVRLNV